MIKKLLLGLRFRLAVHKANRQARRYGRKYLVINVGGRLVTLSKSSRCSSAVDTSIAASRQPTSKPMPST